MENRQWIIKKDRSGTDYELNLEEGELENYERQDFNEVSNKIKEGFDSLKLFYDNVENDTILITKMIVHYVYYITKKNTEQWLML